DDGEGLRLGRLVELDAAELLRHAERTDADLLRAFEDRGRQPLFRHHAPFALPIAADERNDDVFDEFAAALPHHALLFREAWHGDFSRCERAHLNATGAAGPLTVRPRAGGERGLHALIPKTGSPLSWGRTERGQRPTSHIFNCQTAQASAAPVLVGLGVCPSLFPSPQK